MGETYGIIEAGIHAAMPFMHSIKRISTQDRTDDLLVFTVRVGGAGPQLNVKSLLYGRFIQIKIVYSVPYIE